MGFNPGFDAGKLSLLIEESHADIILTSTRHNIQYLTGGYYYPLYAWDSHTKETQYLSFLCVPREDVSSSFFIGRPGEDSVLAEAGTWISKCYEAPAIGTRPAAEAAVDILKAGGYASKCIGLELSSLPADAWEVLKNGLPEASFIDISGLMDSMRAVKSGSEIEIIKKGTLLNIEAVESVLSGKGPGISTMELADEVASGFRRRGLHYLYSLVCAGPSYFRAASVKRCLEDNRVFHIDAGALTNGYVVEVCRTGNVGMISEHAAEMMRGCRELEDYILSRIKPGKPVSNLQKEADEFLSEHPLGDIGKFIAHGIGMVHHEKPVVSLGSEEVFEAGMVISIEMEFRNTQVGHVKREDMVVITGNGCDVILP